MDKVMIKDNIVLTRKEDIYPFMTEGSVVYLLTDCHQSEKWAGLYFCQFEMS